MSENNGLFVTEDGFVSDDSGEVKPSDGGNSFGIHVIPTAKVENSLHEASEEGSEESEEKKETTLIHSPVLKRRRKKQRKKKKGSNIAEEQKEPKKENPSIRTKKEGKKKSLVDEILSREYWRKKRRRKMKRRKERMKKMDERKVVVVKSPPVKKQSPDMKDVSPIPDQYDRKEILDGEVRGWNADEDSIEVLNQKIKEVLEEKEEKNKDEEGEKETEGETNEKKEEINGEKEEGKVSQMRDDQIWDVADGIFRDGEEFFDVEARTKKLLEEIDEEKILKELSGKGEKKGSNIEGESKKEMETIINNQELFSVEGELNEIFGIKPEEPEDEEVEETSPKPLKSKRKRRKRKKKVYKSVLDEVLSPGYWKNSSRNRGEKGKKKDSRKKKTKKGKKK